MGCPDANLLAAFVDARLGAEESEAVEQHVDSCRECGELIAELARAGGTDPRRAETPAELVTPAPLRGRALGEFVVRAPLGEGGFGAVYLAEQKGLGREAVVKVPHLRHRASPAMVERFMREARLASRLDHPYAAHVYAFGAEPDGLLWIAMERVRGTTLSELLERQTRIPLERLVPLLDRLCEVVQSAHEMGIVHRDIKPANVMVLSRAGRLLPKLLDFGVAKLGAEPAEPGAVADDVALTQASAASAY